MNENTTTTQPTNESRATDAKLHTLLFGITASWMPELPHYSTDDRAARQAELALAPELREDYAEELHAITHGGWALVIPADGTKSICEGGFTFNYTVMFRLITATAAQRALALVQVLERVRGEVNQ